MKVLTLHQPWASLVALGVKTIETRSWSTKYRGQLAIHASTLRHRRMTCRLGQWQYGGLSQCLWREDERHYVRDYQHVPVGAIVATATLVDVVPILAADDELTVAWQPHVAETYQGKLSHWAGPNMDVPEVACTGRQPWKITEIEDQRPYGDFTPGRFAWLLADAQPVDPPVLFKGGQGLSRSWEPEEAAA